MKQVAFNLKKQEAKVRVESIDDLWYLSHLIDIGDRVKGKSLRKIKLGEVTEKARAVRKSIFVTLKVTQVELGKTADTLRIAGTIEEGPEEIPKGAHQSITVEIGTVLTIIKEAWLGYQINKLKEAVASKAAPIILVVFDRDEAYIAVTKKEVFSGM